MDLDTPLWAIVPAAGTGQRVGGDLPKQYQLLAGQPMLAHTLQRMLDVPGMAGVVAVLSAEDQHWHSIKAGNEPRMHICTGGDARADSVKAGLRYVLDKAPENTWVLVHDAARPLVALSDVQRLTQVVYNSGAVGGLLATPVQDTLKKADDYCCVAQTVKRAGLWQAQTPQMFRAGQLLDALTVADSTITDDASAMEQVGHEPQLVESLQPNFKVTRLMDMQLADTLLVSAGIA